MPTLRRILSTAALSVLMVGGCRTIEESPFETGCIAQVLSAESLPLSATHLHARVNFHLAANGVKGAQIRVDEGVARSYVADPDLFRASLLDRCGQTLYTIKTWDPRVMRYYERSNLPVDEPYAGPAEVNFFSLPRNVRTGHEEPRGWGERLVMVEETPVEIVLPIVRGLYAVRFSFPDGKDLGLIPVDSTIRAACASGQASREGCLRWGGLQDRR